MPQPTRSFRVIELITILVIAGLIVAVALPHWARNSNTAATPNQPPPASTPAAP